MTEGRPTSPPIDDDYLAVIKAAEEMDAIILLTHSFGLHAVSHKSIDVYIGMRRSSADEFMRRTRFITVPPNSDAHTGRSPLLGPHREPLIWDTVEATPGLFRTRIVRFNAAGGLIPAVWITLGPKKWALGLSADMTRARIAAVGFLGDAGPQQLCHDNGRYTLGIRSFARLRDDYGV